MKGCFNLLNKIGYFSIASGSSGNCGVFFCGDTIILIDMGVSVRKLNNALAGLGLAVDMLDAVLITHEHSDHIKGLSTFAKKYDIPVFMTEGTASAVLQKIPHAHNIIHTFIGSERFFIKSVEVNSFLTPHDANESVGFILKCEEITFGFATDLGFIPLNVKNMLCKCDFVVIEANHDIDMLRNNTMYPYQTKQRILGNLGHLSNAACAECVVDLVKNGVNTIVLSHLSEKNNSPVKALRYINQMLFIAGLTCELFVAPVNEMEKPIFCEMEVDKCLALG